MKHCQKEMLVYFGIAYLNLFYLTNGHIISGYGNKLCKNLQIKLTTAALKNNAFVMI